MSIGAQDYASLAKDSYQDRREWIGLPPKGITLNGHLYRAIDAQNSPSGFQATAYQQADPPKGIVIAYRGTQGLQDIAVDTNMVADNINPQEADARAFTERVIKYAREHGIPLDQVTVTGHSLGGTLAEIEAARFGLRGATFNAYGAVDLGYGIPQGGHRVIDYVVATDVVSAASRHYGQLVQLAAPDDITALQAAGYMAGCGKMLDVALKRGPSAHSIDNFAPGSGSTSILSPEAEALAKANARPIAAFDRDVHGAREGLRLASRMPGTPVWSLARNAEIAGATMTAGASLAEGAQAAGHFAEQKAAAAQRAAELTAQTILHTAQRVSTAVEREAGAAAQAIESGVHAAREAVVHQATRVSHAATQAATEIGNGAERVRNGVAHGAHEIRRGLGAAAARTEATLLRFSDPNHAQHAVYAALKARLPPGTSEDRLAQCTAACHAARLDKPEHLGEVYVTHTKALFFNNSLFGHMAEVDLTRPAPPLQYSLQQAEQHNRQHEVQSAQLTQPALRPVHLR